MTIKLGMGSFVQTCARKDTSGEMEKYSIIVGLKKKKKKKQVNVKNDTDSTEYWG
jgi:ribonuclease HI